MRKDECGRTEWVKHSRNSAVGKRGHNKRVRLAVKLEVVELTEEQLPDTAYCTLTEGAPMPEADQLELDRLADDGNQHGE